MAWERLNKKDNKEMSMIVYNKDCHLYQAKEHNIVQQYRTNLSNFQQIFMIA